MEGGDVPAVPKITHAHEKDLRTILNKFFNNLKCYNVDLNIHKFINPVYSASAAEKFKTRFRLTNLLKNSILVTVHHKQNNFFL